MLLVLLLLLVLLTLFVRLEVALIVALLDASCSHSGVDVALCDEEEEEEDDEEEELEKWSLVRLREEREEVAEPIRERDPEDRDESSTDQEQR